MSQELTGILADIFGSVESVLEPLSEREWKTPTDLPGWSVQDVVSHLTAVELLLVGRPPATHQAPAAEWVRNDLGAYNENEVDVRRACTGPEVLAELRHAVGERLAQLAGWDEVDWLTPAITPVGPGTNRSFLELRLMDWWIHEQDIRRAVGRPGGWGTEAAVHALHRLRMGMPRVVGKNVKPPDGTTVCFNVKDVARFVIVQEAGRSHFGDADTPDVTLTMDQETFVMLTCGRRPVSDLTVVVSGDDALGAAVLANANIMF